VQHLDYQYSLDQLHSFYGHQIFRNIDKPLLEGRLEISGIFIGQPQLIASLICLVAFYSSLFICNKN